MIASTSKGSVITGYSNLRAVTGSIREARRAGARPKITPVRIAEQRAVMIAQKGIDAGIGLYMAISLARIPPPIIPVAPPRKVKSEDSTRNCHSISLRRAPTAFLIPISRVLSVTEIIIIPMTPIPPTKSPTEDKASMTSRKTPMNLSRFSTSSSELMTLKSSV